jgi:hypothetical protein
MEGTIELATAGGLTTPDLARLLPCCLALTSGLQFVLTASRDPSTSKDHIETLEGPDCLAMKPTSIRRCRRSGSSRSSRRLRLCESWKEK